MGNIVIPDDMDELDVKKLTLSVIGGSLERREAMMAPAFKDGRVPDNPREIRLQNDLLVAQETTALTLLGIYEKAGETNSLEAMRDIVSQAIKDSNAEIRGEIIPEVSDNILGVEGAEIIVEGVEVRLNEYLEE